MKTPIKIEKGITPPVQFPGKYDTYFPFKDLNVGDSFVVALETRTSWAFIFTAIQVAQKKHNIKLTSRLIEQDKRRVWRVA